MADRTALWVVQSDGSGAKHQSELLTERIDGWDIEPVVAAPVGISRNDAFIESRDGLVPVDSFAEVVRSTDPDVVFYHHFNEHIAETHPEVKQHCPTVFRVGINFWEVTMGGPTLSQALPEMVDFITHQDRLVAPSKHVYRRIADIGYPEEQIDVIPTVYDFPDEQPTPDGAKKDTIGHLAARINPLKNQLTTVLALRAMYERFGTVEPEAIVTGGVTGYAESIQGVAEAVKIDHKVSFPGYIENLDEKFWPKVDVAVLPSFSENAPMTVLESVANGVPVVVAEGGWTDEYDSVVTAPADDPGRWAVEAGRLLAEPDHRSRVAFEQYEELSDRFDAERIAGWYQQSLSVTASKE